MAGGAARVSLESHRAIEAAVGLLLLLVPFALRFGLEDGVDFSGEAIIACAVLGLAAATLGFAGTRLGSDPSGLSHATFDRGLTVAIAITAAVFALRGEAEGAIALVAAAVAYAWLLIATRYVGPG